ncbi:MAG TPA: SIMPL domain-containing protein [Terriglobales bacterium]|nr:SIMPL domain-containing protein [Terriglobales bacterium]
MKAQFLMLFAIVIAATSFAQQPPTVTVQPDTLYVGADGRFEAAPDTALVQFNISTQELSSKAAYDRGARAAEQIREVLRKNGIDVKQAEIGFFSLTPVYDYRNPKRKLIAYRVNSSVTLKLRDFSKVGPIVQQLGDIDVTENQTVSYTLENIDAAKVRAVEDAFQRARAEAAALARAGGRVLGELSFASVDTFEPVRPLPQAMYKASRTMEATAADMAAAPPTSEFTPQQIQVTAHVNALFTLR